MDYPIVSTGTEPRFDALGVIKLRCAPATPVDDRIFAQAQVGRTAALLFVRIWSFETAPAQNATVRAVLCHGGHTLDLSATVAGTASLLLDGVPVEDRLTAYQVSGEDLQGEYWGAVMLLSFDWMMEVLALEKDSPAVLSGNLSRENPAVSCAALEGEALRLLIS